MNKTVKKIISSIAISVLTVLIGFGVTLVTFNLFDSLTTNQMRILFTLDFVCLIAVGGIFLYLSENKNVKKKKRQSFEKRQKERAEKNERETEEINKIMSNSGYAA